MLSNHKARFMTAGPVLWYQPSASVIFLGSVTEYLGKQSKGSQLYSDSEFDGAKYMVAGA